jgi:hypothetical protein
MSDRVGFLEESAGVRSMTRLTIAAIVVAVLALVGHRVLVTSIKGKPEATVLSALAGVLGALVAKGCVAIINRNGGSDDAK